MVIGIYIVKIYACILANCLGLVVQTLSFFFFHSCTVPLSIPADKATFETNAKLNLIKLKFPEQVSITRCCTSLLNMTLYMYSSQSLNHFISQVLGIFPGRQPTNYTVQIQYIDEANQPPCSCPTSNSTIDGYIVLTLLCNTTTCPIDRHRLCQATVIATNNAGTTNSDPELEISMRFTKDFQSCSITLIHKHKYFVYHVSNYLTSQHV